MDAAAAGDGGSFSLLAGAAQDELFRFALAQGLRWADAAEAVQETLLRAYRLRARWQGGDAAAWLCGIAMNVVREQRRRLKRRGEVGLDESLLAGAAAGDEAAEIDPRQIPLAMESLSDRQREAIACRYLRQMSVRQTAEAMGCAEGTVKATLHAALAAVRKKMRVQDDKRM